MIMQFLFQVVLLLSSLPIKVVAAPRLTKPNCQSSCGNVSLPFPFGIGADCYLNHWYAVDCISGKPFLRSIKQEVLNISLKNNTVLVNQPVLSSCTQYPQISSVNLENSPFYFSQTRNIFTGVGCYNLASFSSSNSILGHCFSSCDHDGERDEKHCYGIDCCQTRIPRFLSSLNISISSINFGSNGQQGECQYAFLVEQEWFYNCFTSRKDVQNWKQVPVVLDWQVVNSSLHELQFSNSSHENAIMRCRTYNFHEFLQCEWSEGYEGNPYLPDGCQDINECLAEDKEICMKNERCENYMGGYRCLQRGLIEIDRRRKTFMIITGPAASLGGLIVLLGIWWMGIKLGKRISQKEKNFKRNGGLLLQQQLETLDDGIERCKIFNSTELDKATDHFNVNRILGQGGQGTVYKGMLSDGRIIAIKKFKVVDGGKLEEFINEVVILSQINHRNVVKLLGCCLETEFPLLVYEFISNGTLFQYIHDQNEELPLTWEMRLRIATDAAEALSYLHSAAYLPIYHRDIKSTNILLDEKYRAKIADFGISRSSTIDQTHISTKVRGTFGYFDPEYFHSCQFTDKSDVYSFGVVLVELLTGEKPISSTWAEEGGNLASYFLKSMEENRLYDILDAQVTNQLGKSEEIVAIANVAKRCLNMIGKNRPTMKQVAVELERIRASQDHDSNLKQYSQDIENTKTARDIVSTLSAGAILDHENVTLSLSMEVKPLTADF